MSERQHHELIIIGGGPGGYVAAIRAAQLGMNVACIEQEETLGGTCVRVGCIPSKALLESSEHYYQAKNELDNHGITVGDLSVDIAKMMKRKQSVVDANTNGVASLFKKNGVTRYQGKGSFVEKGVVKVDGKDSHELTYDNVIIATGSSVMELPDIKPDGKNIVTSKEALAFEHVPEHLIVIGGGYIGLELGSVWSRLGAEVTVVEYMKRILPAMDEDLSKEALKIFKKQGLTFQLGTKVTGVKVDGDKCVVSVEGGEDIVGDKVLLSVGRVPNTSGLNLEAIGVSTTDRGFIETDGHYKTNIDGIYAIGDVIGGAMLAHKAEDEGVVCVERIAGQAGHVKYNAIPGIVYTHPEIASVGKTEQELKDEGVSYKKGKFPFKANGRARAINQTDGFVKILADEKTDRILGAHIIGAHAGDLIAELALAIEFDASAEDVAMTCHAHPTLAEVVKEAALAIGDGAIHI